MHPEARSQSSETQGALREPLLKLVHFMRSMEYTDGQGREISLDLLDEVIGQFPYQSPSVFNFYVPDYQPPRFSEGLVAPEFQILTAPALVNFLNGMWALIDNGLSACEGGFGVGSTSLLCNNDGQLSGRLGANMQRGTLAFTESNPIDETLMEMALLLTGSRLNASMSVVKE